MATLAITSPVPAATGLTYAQHIGRAVRALFAVLFAAKPAVPAAPNSGDEMLSLFRLQCMASPYDSVMPNQLQELMVIAARRE